MRNKLNSLLFTLALMPYLLPQRVFAAVGERADKVEINRGWHLFLEEYNLIIGVVVAVGVMTGVLAFVVLLTKLAAVADNPKERGDVLKELFMVGITTSLLGAFYFIVAMYYSILLG